MTFSTLRSPLALFSSWSLGRSDRKPGRSRRDSLRSRRGGLGSWEQLGLGMGEVEQLEQRSLMAADLVLAFNDNITANYSTGLNDRAINSGASPHRTASANAAAPGDHCGGINVSTRHH